MSRLSRERLAQQKQRRRGKKVSPIDIKLKALRKWNKENRPLTLREIADFCGCSRELIRLIEQRALEKLQFRLNIEDLEIFSNNHQIAGYTKHKQKLHK